MRTARRTFLLLLIIGAAGLSPAPLVGAQTPTDTAETPTDTAETDEPQDDTTDDTTGDTTDDTTGDTSGDTETRAQTQDDDLPTTGAPVWLFGASGLAVLLSGSILVGVDRRVRADLPAAYWEDHRDP